MKKTYIAPTSQFRMMAAQQMMALSMVPGAGGEGEAPALGEGAGTDGDTDSDGLVKGDNIWDMEW